MSPAPESRGARVLLTGGTGFLGKAVLSRLLHTRRVERVWVLSRELRSHPDPRVQVLAADLTQAKALRSLQIDPDQVIHLAGLYDFRASSSELYLQNVLATLHLVDQLRFWSRARPVPLHFASTYAVAFEEERPGFEDEEPLQEFPPPRMAYAHTKAIAERIVVRSGLPARVFRLGALVEPGVPLGPERSDGPYPFVEALWRSRSFFSGGGVPIPADPDGVLPLVPVGAAAQLFVRSVLELPPPKAAEIFGAYHPQSVSLREFSEATLEALGIPGRPRFLTRLPRSLLGLQQWVTGVPQEAFEFSLLPPRLWNPRFMKQFGEQAVPAFETYRSEFFIPWKERG